MALPTIRKSIQTLMEKKPSSNLRALAASKVYLTPLGLALPQPFHSTPRYCPDSLYLFCPAIPRLCITKMSKKCVLRLEIHSDKNKKAALKAAAGVAGVDSVAIDMQKQQITVVGSADPVYLTNKLRKLGSTQLMTVGPAKEEKKEEKNPAEGSKVVYLPTGGTPYYDSYYYVIPEESPSTCCIS